jgi:carbamoyl-phosphate synthase/aspartate carbamoyltransferase
MASSCISTDLLYQSKQPGFSDCQLAGCLGTNELAVCRLSEEHGNLLFIKQIDTVAAGFPSYTNYLYSTYNAVDFQTGR